MANTDLSGNHSAAVKLGPGFFQAVADVVHVAVVVIVLVYFFQAVRDLEKRDISQAVILDG